MNSVSFDGRLAADAELKYTGNGDPVLGFRVASDVGFGDKKVTNWFNCAIWGKRGESMQEYMIKGTPVTVYGVLSLRPYKDSQGNEKLSPDVRVNDVTLQGKKEEGQRQQEHQPEPSAPRRTDKQPPAPKDDDFDSDIPFN